MELAESCGATALLRASLHNVLCSQILFGNFDGARNTAARLRDRWGATEGYSLSLAAAELDLALATGRYEDATSIDTAFAPLAAARPSVASDWYLISRTHYL